MSTLFKSLGLYLLLTVVTTAILTTLLSVAGQVTTLLWSSLFLGTLDAVISTLLYRKNKNLVLIPSLVIFIISNGLCNFWPENIAGFLVLLYFIKYLPNGYAFALLIALGQCVSSITLKLYGQGASSLIPIFNIMGFLIYKLNESKPIFTATELSGKKTLQNLLTRASEQWANYLKGINAPQIIGLIFCSLSFIMFIVKIKNQ